jgi:hypothetical protein
MAGLPLTNKLVEVLPNKTKPRVEDDPFMKIVEEELRKGTPAQLARAVATAPPATAAVAARILNAAKGGWAKVKSLFEKSDEDRLMDIAYEVIHDGAAPPTWKEKALKTIMEIFEIGKCGLKGAARVAGAALASFSPTGLQRMLKGSRLQLITSRYAPTKISGLTVSSGPRMFLTSRYSPMKLPSLPNTRQKVVEEVAKEAAAEEAATGAKPTPEALSVRIAKKLKASPAAILQGLKNGLLAIPPGRISGTRYANPKRTPKQIIAEKELANLAKKLQMEPRELLKNPQATTILARRLRDPATPMSNAEARALYNKLVANSTPFQRTPKARYLTVPKARGAEKNMNTKKGEMNAFAKTLTGGGELPATFNGEPVNVHAGWRQYGARPLTLGPAAQAAVEARLKTLLSNKRVKNAINLAVKYRTMNRNTAEWQALGLVPPSSSTSTRELMNMYRNYGRTLHESARDKISMLLRQKAVNAARALRSGSLNSDRLRMWAAHLSSNPEAANYASNFMPALRNYIKREASNRNATSALRRLERIRANTSGLNVRENIASAQRQIMERMRREQNNKRRMLNANRASRGLAPLTRPIPYYPNQPPIPGFGNLRPSFEAPPNRPQFGAVPRPMPQIPPMPIMANTPPPPIENILPPAEKNAVLNAGGANKALNLVQSAGGVTDVVKTANILKSVGNNPNAAVAAGANAKNVKIVLQLGGANNALKVANAVPKLKKRRRSKKAAKPKPPRVKEIKKLIEYLGSKENLVKKLPNKENREKKLTKKQIVSKITRHLLRKN